MSQDPYDPKRTLLSRIWYQIVRNSTGAILISTCGVRATGRKRIPEAGPTLMMANHSSYYDTVVLGVVQLRFIDFMARSGLFFPVLGHFLRSMGAFPVLREGGGAAGIKETLKRLKSARLIGLFPEGTRSPDGKVQQLKGGVANIAKKSSSSVLCVGIFGTFEAWSRWQPWPGSYPLHVHYSEPISPEELRNLDESQAMALMQKRLEESLEVASKEVARLRHYLIF